MSLAPDDLALLDFERCSWQAPGAKGDAIRTRFGISPATYYARLGQLIDRPEALVADPLLVRRLRKARADRRRVRYEGPLRKRSQP